MSFTSVFRTGAICLAVLAAGSVGVSAARAAYIDPSGYIIAGGSKFQLQDVGQSLWYANPAGTYRGRIGLFRAHLLITGSEVTATNLAGNTPAMSASKAVPTLNAANGVVQATTMRTLSYGGNPYLQIWQGWTFTDTSLTIQTQLYAPRTIWLQEPDILASVAGYSTPNSWADGYTSGNAFTDSVTPYYLNHDATTTTFHWPSTTAYLLTNPFIPADYTSYRLDDDRGFRTLLGSSARLSNPQFLGIDIFGSGRGVTGSYATSSTNNQRWEGAWAADGTFSLHLVAWNGGAGAVVCADGYADTSNGHCGGNIANQTLLYAPNLWRQFSAGSLVTEYTTLHY